MVLIMLCSLLNDFENLIEYVCLDVFLKFISPKQQHASRFVKFHLMAVDINEIKGSREMEGTMHNREFSSCALDVRVCFIDQA